MAPPNRHQGPFGEETPVMAGNGMMGTGQSSQATLSDTSAAALPQPLVTEDSPIRVASSVTGSAAVEMTWDSFVRKYVYDPAAKAISEQAEEFVKQGAMTRKQAASWANQQRNALVIAVRDQKNSPLGRAYSEFKKPRDTLPSLDDLVEKQLKKNPNQTMKQVYEAIIKSSGKSNVAVNRLAVAFRWAGPAAIVVDISFSAYLIYTAPPDERGRVAARQIGGTVGAASFGWAGAKCGCAAGGAIGAPFAGVGAAPGCLIGAGVGLIGFSILGYNLGSDAGDFYYDAAPTVVEWVQEQTKTATSPAP
jgi:hypothetical protein